MIFPVRLILAIQLGVAAVLGQGINKPAAFPNLDRFGPALNTLPRASTRISPWISGNIPKGCRDRVLYDKLDPTKFKAYTVYMGDCDMPWHFCREDGAEPSLDKLVDSVARVPIGMRQFIGDIVHFKNGGGATAWQASIVHASGQSAAHVGTFLHESSHCVDGANGIGMKPDDAIWRDAFNRDSHVADEYSRVSHGENFAQYAGLVIYDRFTNWHFQNTWPTQYRSVAQQIHRMAITADAQHSWGSHMLDYSGNKRCGRRWAHTPAVNPATGNIVGKRDVQFSRRWAGISIDSVPEDVSNEITSNCTIIGGHF